MGYLRHAEMIVTDGPTSGAPDYTFPGFSDVYRVGCNGINTRRRIAYAATLHWHEDRIFASDFYGGNIQVYDGDFRHLRTWDAGFTLPEGIKSRGDELLVGYQVQYVFGFPISNGLGFFDIRTGVERRRIETQFSVEDFDFLDWNNIVYSTERNVTINGVNARGILFKLNLATGEETIFADLSSYIQRTEFTQAWYAVVDRCGNVFATASSGIREDGSYIEGWLCKFGPDGTGIWARKFPTGIQNPYSIKFNRTRTYLYVVQYGWVDADQGAYWPDFNNDKPIFKISPVDGAGIERPIASVPFHPLWGASLTSMTYPSPPNATILEVSPPKHDWSYDRQGPTDKWTDGLILPPFRKEGSVLVPRIRYEADPIEEPDEPDEFPEPWAWYRSDDLDAGSVFEWPDRAGGAGPMTTDTDPADDGDPDTTYHVVASGVGGQPAVSAPLLGGYAWLERTTTTRPETDGVTIFAVVDTARFWLVVREVSPSWQAQVDVEEVGANETYAYFINDSPAFGSNSAGAEVPHGMPMAVMAVFPPDGGDARMFIDGTEVLAPIVSDTAPVQLLNWLQGDPTTERDSLIAEVSVWTRNLDATEQGQVWDYVQDRYGIGS